VSRIPIRVRLTAAFAVAMAVVLAATGEFLYRRTDAQLTAAIDRQLRLRAQDLAALVREPRSSLADDAGGTLVEQGESFAQLLDDRGRVLDATRPLAAASLLRPDELAAARERTILADRRSVPGLDERSRLLATPASRGGQRLVLVVGVTAGDRAETLSSLRDELVVAGLVALALASLGGYVLAGRALRPVESMRARAEAISADTPGERLPEPRTGDEVARLAQTLNAMLARLETALERERGFVADAGHELRTPLALLRTELELALRHATTADELRAAVRASSAEVDRLTQLAEDLLVIARSDRGTLPLRLETLAADDVLGTVASRFEWRAREECRRVVAEPAGPCALRGDRLRLEQALGNLVDNALRHGAGTVRIAAERAAATTVLRVTDEGHGVPPEFVPHAFERFSRPDRGRSGGGAGLGLAIVSVIARAHGGDAGLRNTVPHGVEAWIAIPVSGFPKPVEHENSM
jgi:heavy metal sensor kinase